MTSSSTSSLSLLLKLSRRSTRPHSDRLFSTCNHSKAGQISSITSRAIIYKHHGDPDQVLQAIEYDLPPLKEGELRIRFDRGAINPADINVIQGVYPTKPVKRDDLGGVSIMGNEGTGVVQGLKEDGKVEKTFKLGDRVVMGAAQLGTWQTHSNLTSDQLINISDSNLDATQACTISINPTTAFRMLTDFIPLNPSTSSSSSSTTTTSNPSIEGKEGDRTSRKKRQWIIQNGANSAVGLSVIQLAHQWGHSTLNLIRSRDDFTSLENEMMSLGATKVMTYEEFLSKESRKMIKEMIGEGELKLALNCVGGKEINEMCKLLNKDGVLVTYGGMAKTSLNLSPSLFIFKNLKAKGFWLSNWVKHNPGGRQTMMSEIAQLTSQGRLRVPETRTISIGPNSRLSLDQMGEKVREVMKRLEGGKEKKILLDFE